jgi:WD40 repeat protein
VPAVRGERHARHHFLVAEENGMLGGAQMDFRRPQGPQPDPTRARSLLGTSPGLARKRLASASYDKTVRVWDAQTGQEALTFKVHTGRVLSLSGLVYSVSFSPDGKRLASSIAVQTVKVWDATPPPDARNGLPDPKR